MKEALLSFARKTPLRSMYFWLRIAYYELRMPRKNHIFRKTMNKITTEPQSIITDEILKNLSFGWGNQKYSAGIDYLKDCIKYIPQAKFHVLECGSGLTTLIAGIVAQKYGNTVWSLEHSYFWYKKVQRYLRKYHIKSVKLFYCPPVDYHAFSWIESVKLLRYPPLDHGNLLWYDAPLDVMPDKFSLIICDGHAGGNMEGQYCVFPIMKQKFIPGSVILFDSANRNYEQANISGWAQALDMSYEICGDKRPYYLLIHK